MIINYFNKIIMNIENNSWSLKQLYSNYKFLSKPKFNRDMKWTVLSTNDKKKPSFEKYIKFLIETKNSVFPISLGTFIKDKQEYYTVIDGNNRINAIITFLKTPYKIFEIDEEYISVFDSINKSNLSIVQKSCIINLIKEMDYNTISRFRRFADILNVDFEIENTLYREIENKLIKIQNKFTYSDGDFYDNKINISINIFKNGTINQYNKIYDDINRYTNQLSINELLASSLYDTEININDKKLSLFIKNKVKDFYNNRGEKELLNQFKIDDITELELNAFDFMVGFQNYMSEKYNIIPDFHPSGLSEFFKIFKYLYSSYEKDKFTSDNIKDFIKNIDESCHILNLAFNKLFSEICLGIYIFSI